METSFRPSDANQLARYYYNDDGVVISVEEIQPKGTIRVIKFEDTNSNQIEDPEELLGRGYGDLDAGCEAPALGGPRRGVGAEAEQYLQDHRTHQGQAETLQQWSSVVHAPGAEAYVKGRRRDDGNAEQDVREQELGEVPLGGPEKQLPQ